MKTALLRRLKRLEEVRAVETQASVEFQMGYVKKLPEEYNGERHMVTVGRAADGGCAAVKTVERRLDRLEDRLAPQVGSSS